MPLPRFCAYFLLQILQFLLMVCKNRFVPPVLGTLARPMITLWLPLLRHNRFAPASADWTYRGERKIDKP